jgi:hypothetical protein
MEGHGAANYTAVMTQARAEGRTDGASLCKRLIASIMPRVFDRKIAETVTIS